MAIIDQATLRHLYIDEQLSIRSIADRLHVAPRTVHDAMIRSRIPRRQTWQHHRKSSSSSAHAPQLDQATLRQLYLIEQRSIREIAIAFDIFPSVIHNALVRWNIPRRRRGRPSKKLSKNDGQNQAE